MSVIVVLVTALAVCVLVGNLGYKAVVNHYKGSNSNSNSNSKSASLSSSTSTTTATSKTASTSTSSSTTHISRRLDDPKYEAAMAKYKKWSEEQTFQLGTWMLSEYRSNPSVTFYPFYHLHKGDLNPENEFMPPPTEEEGNINSGGRGRRRLYSSLKPLPDISSNNPDINYRREDVILISQLGEFRVYHLNNSGLNESDWTLLKPFSSVEVVKFVNSSRAESYYFQGGDARYFQHRDKPYVAFVTMDNTYHMNFAELKFDVQEQALYFDLPGKKISVEHEYGVRHQKNWSPFEHTDKFGVSRLLFIQNTAPHRIVHANETTESNGKILKGYTICSTQFADLNWPFGEPRGGTPAVLVDTKYGKKYLTFFHSSGRNVLNWLQTYFFGAYLFNPEPPFAITHIAPNPIIPWTWYDEYTSGWSFKAIDYIIFPMGFIIRNGNIFLTAGRNDRQAWILKMNFTLLVDYLIPTIGSTVLRDTYDEHMAKFECNYQREHKFKNYSKSVPGCSNSR